MASIWLKLAAASTLAVTTAGCMGIRDHRGYVLDKELSANVQVGTTNATVEVPSVEATEKTVTVPNVEVDKPKQ